MPTAEEIRAKNIMKELTNTGLFLIKGIFIALCFISILEIAWIGYLMLGITVIFLAGNLGTITRLIVIHQTLIHQANQAKQPPQQIF